MTALPVLGSCLNYKLFSINAEVLFDNSFLNIISIESEAMVARVFFMFYRFRD